MQELSEKPVVLMLDKPHFQVKLHPDSLEVDLKEGARKELEKLVEARPFLRDTLGLLFQTIIPLDVSLWEIEEVKADSTGKVHVSIPQRKDITLPLKPAEAKKLVEQLNELIPVEKQKAYERLKRFEEAEREIERRKGEVVRRVRKVP